jgi:hypothetical protein
LHRMQGRECDVVVVLPVIYSKNPTNVRLFESISANTTAGHTRATAKFFGPCMRDWDGFHIPNRCQSRMGN